MPRRLRQKVLALATPHGPDWFLRLHAALFALLPARDDAFAVDDTTYLCRRTLEEQGASLRFMEYWLDPFTETISMSWGVDIGAGAFAGQIPEQVFQQSVEFLVKGLVQQRPVLVKRQREVPFEPGRFAHTTHGRR